MGGGRESGVADFGDLGIGDPGAGVGVLDGAGITHWSPRCFVPSPRCTGVGAAYVGSPAWDEFIKRRVERNTLPGRITVAAARSLESVMRSRYPDFRAKDAGGAAALMLGRGKNAVMLERMLIAIVRQAAVDPVQLPRDRVFLTLVVLPAKLTLGVSNQDQIHHLSDSPAPSCNPKTRRCRQSPGVRVRCKMVELQRSSRLCRQSKARTQTRILPGQKVELRGFEPLTPTLPGPGSQAEQVVYGAWRTVVNVVGSATGVSIVVRPVVNPAH
jgi:hypothetical protein